MRLWVLVSLWLLSAILMPWCHGCDKQVKVHIRQHEKRCAALLKTLEDTPGLKRKHEEEEREREAKHRRLEEERIAREAAVQEEQARRQVCSLGRLPLALTD